MCAAIVGDPIYQKGLVARAKDGKLSPAVEAMLWHYAYGKPKEQVELSGPRGGPIAMDLSTLTDAELAAQAEALAKQLREDAP